MFQVDDYIICGGNGVCKVLDINVPNIGINKEKKEYYKLSPIYENGSVVYTPVNNDKVVMRKIISKEEAEELIEDISLIETLTFDNEKYCEAKYKEVMHKYDCREWLKIIKTSHIRKKERIADGKKSTVTDDKYLKMAEEYLLGELTVSLNMSKESVKKLISQKIKKLAI